MADEQRNAKDDEMNLDRRHRRSGVAILTAVVTIAIMVAIVTEVTYLSRSKSVIAYNQRNRVQAYWLARSESTSTPLFWQQTINSAKLLHSAIWPWRLALANDPLPQHWANAHSLQQRAATASVMNQSNNSKADGTVSEEVSELTREGTSVFNDRNFLDFEGDFSAELVDNESRIDLNQLNTDQPLKKSSGTTTLFVDEL